MKIWGTVETEVWYTRSMLARTLERKAKGLIASYPHPHRKGENIVVKIPYSAIRHLSKRGTEAYAITYVAAEWTGKESISAPPVLDEATGMWRCKSAIKSTSFFLAVGTSRFERNGKPWTPPEN